MNGHTARAEAINGMLRNAEGWMAKILPDVIKFLKKKRGKKITGEDITNIANKAGGQPHHPNVYGGLFHKLVLSELLTFTGDWKHMEKVSSHARKTPVWKVK